MPQNFNLDLQALQLFQLLIRERSVTRTAELLGVSQSWTSEMLARLRESFADPLLVRTKGGMVATARATELLPMVCAAADNLRLLLEQGVRFEPSTAKRRFRIATSDFIEVLLMGGLTDQMAKSAPEVGLDILTVNVLRLERALETAEIDLAIAVSPDPPANLRRLPLFSDRHVCVVRSDHPVDFSELTPDGFAGLGHIGVAPSGLTYFSGIVDAALANLGVRRRIAVTTPHFLVAAHLASKSDLVLCLPFRAAQAVASTLPVRIVEIPFATKKIDIAMYWHERCHADVAHRWFRMQIRRSLAPPSKGDRACVDETGCGDRKSQENAIETSPSPPIFA